MAVNREDDVQQTVFGAPLAFEYTDKILAALKDERKAWARLVNATVAEQDAMAMFAATSTEKSAVAHGEAFDKYAAAKQALRDLGVDVDNLLEGR